MRIKRNVIPSTVLVFSLLVCSACGDTRAEGHYDRGHDYAAEGALDLAIAEFDQAIDLNPEYIAAYVARGTAFPEAERAGALSRVPPAT